MRIIIIPLLFVIFANIYAIFSKSFHESSFCFICSLVSSRDPW
ncbi:hypothetical protein D931_02190 [Enterococcus faecium 13.SD.W.09]|nr:hypothetical protein D931_02190 [Enterococcus faecium 13.SD.W.09]